MNTLVQRQYFIDTVPLPPHLTIDGLQAAMAEVATVIGHVNASLETAGYGRLDATMQRNVFSGLVSNYLTRSLTGHTALVMNHETRYPDLVHPGGGGLEIKVTGDAAKGGESHNGHAGWHLIASYAVPDGRLVWSCVKVADLTPNDWRYQGSRRSPGGSQRTETYTTTPRGRAKLLEGICYLDPTLADPSRWRWDAGYAMAPWSLLGRQATACTV